MKVRSYLSSVHSFACNWQLVLKIEVTQRESGKGRGRLQCCSLRGSSLGSCAVALALHWTLCGSEHLCCAQRKKEELLPGPRRTSGAQLLSGAWSQSKAAGSSKEAAELGQGRLGGQRVGEEERERERHGQGAREQESMRNRKMEVMRPSGRQGNSET